MYVLLDTMAMNRTRTSLSRKGRVVYLCCLSIALIFHVNQHSAAAWNPPFSPSRNVSPPSRSSSQQPKIIQRSLSIKDDTEITRTIEQLTKQFARSMILPLWILSIPFAASASLQYDSLSVGVTSVTPDDIAVHSQSAAQTRNLHTYTSRMSRIPWTTKNAMMKEALPSSSLVVALGNDPQESYSMLDEVWTLIDKYYIDRTYNNQDWKAAKQLYQAKLEAADNNNEVAVVTEMVQSLQDKYSRVLDARAYAQIQKFDLIGVGVTLMPDPITKNIIVGAPPIPESASAKAGLQVGDLVTEVNGRSTQGETAFDIIDQIAEDPNAPTVQMTIVPRAHANEADISRFQRTVTMDRAFQAVKNPVIFTLSERRSDGTKVGYIRISEFNAIVKTKLTDAMSDLQQQGANAFVLDLRHNGGGAFQSAIEISSLFFEDKVATFVVDNTQGKIPFKTANGDVHVPSNVPIAIWLDDMSASASEVFAGSMHDNCRAVLMGDKSFGKGLIQAVYGLKNGAGLVLTVARYVTPDGLDIQGKGIQPDISGHVSLPIPGFISDTSGVDFNEVKQRLDPAICHAPVL